MKILIVENELYLAQSISAKLTENGYSCEIATTAKEAIKDDNFDIVLLSTNISGQNFYPIITKYKNSIIILMIAYISNDTVGNPLKAGAKDYIVKPFMIEELIRKIEHFVDYEKLKKEALEFRSYLEYLFENINDVPINQKEKFPIFIRSENPRTADAYAFEFAKLKGKKIKFISFLNTNWKKELKSISSDVIIYMAPYNSLKKSDKKELLELINLKKVIVSSFDDDEIDIDFVELKSENRVFDTSSILSIDDYIKFTVLSYQSRYPDTELSKKLGISRKSLWEKRKKYGIVKKK